VIVGDALIPVRPPGPGDAFAAPTPTQVEIPVSAVAAVLAGDLHNPTTVAGVLAAAAARDRGWITLRPAEVPMWHLPKGDATPSGPLP
jgi:hypothetical protein